MSGLEDSESLLTRPRNEEAFAEKYLARHLLGIQQAPDGDDLDNVFQLPGAGALADCPAKVKSDMAPFFPRASIGFILPPRASFISGGVSSRKCERAALFCVSVMYMLAIPACARVCIHEFVFSASGRQRGFFYLPFLRPCPLTSSDWINGFCAFSIRRQGNFPNGGFAWNVGSASPYSTSPSAACGLG